MEVNESGAYFLDPQQTCLAYLPAEAIANQEELSQLKEVCREKELQWVDEYKAVWEFCFPYQLNAGDGAKFLLCWVKDRLLGNGVKQYIWAVFILCLWMWGLLKSVQVIRNLGIALLWSGVHVMALVFLAGGLMYLLIMINPKLWSGFLKTETGGIRLQKDGKCWPCSNMIDCRIQMGLVTLEYRESPGKRVQYRAIPAEAFGNMERACQFLLWAIDNGAEWAGGRSYPD